MRKRWIVTAGCFLLLGLAVLAFSGRKPYRHLDASDIVSASVHLSPPNQTVPITDTEALTDCLRELVIYQKDSSYTEYAGQAVVFTLAMADGSTEEIIAYNPFVIINRVGYRTKYEPCEKLSRFANTLRQQEEG